MITIQPMYSHSKAPKLYIHREKREETLTSVGSACLECMLDPSLALCPLLTPFGWGGHNFIWIIILLILVNNKIHNPIDAYSTPMVISRNLLVVPRIWGRTEKGWPINIVYADMIVLNTRCLFSGPLEYNSRILVKLSMNRHWVLSNVMKFNKTLALTPVRRASNGGVGSQGDCVVGAGCTLHKGGGWCNCMQRNH